MGTAQDDNYTAAYKAEMDKLEAAAEAAAKATTTDANQANPPAEPASTTPPAANTADGSANPPAQAAAQDTEADRLAKLEKELESTRKALNDTKKWAGTTAAEVKRLKREQEERTRQANRPQILADNPGLEEAIAFATGKPTGKPAHDPDAWAEAVGNALPEFDALLASSPELQAKATAKARELGEAWNDPIVAIRELNALQIDHVRAGIATAAADQARRDFEQRSKKQTAMQMPSGNGSTTRTPAKADEAARYQTMSSADFQKERARVMGLG